MRLWDLMILETRRACFVRHLVRTGRLTDWPDGEPPTRPRPQAYPVREHLVGPSPERSPSGVRRWFRP